MLVDSQTEIWYPECQKPKESGLKIRERRGRRREEKRERREERGQKISMH